MNKDFLFYYILIAPGARVLCQQSDIFLMKASTTAPFRCHCCWDQFKYAKMSSLLQKAKEIPFIFKTKQSSHFNATLTTTSWVWFNYSLLWVRVIKKKRERKCENEFKSNSRRTRQKLICPNNKITVELQLSECRLKFTFFGVFGSVYTRNDT